MKDIITISSANAIAPLHRNLFRMMGLLYNKPVKFIQGQNAFSIKYNNIQVDISSDGVNNPPKIIEIKFQEEIFNLYCYREVNIEKTLEGYAVSSDIFTPLFDLLSMDEEKGKLKRDRCGLMLGSDSNRGKQGQINLIHDCFLELVKLVSKLLNVEVVSLFPENEYAVVVSFDVDGYYPNQLDELRIYLKKWDINRPTFMVMACSPDEKTIYDPIYPLEDKEVQNLFKDDIEIGLHSSYLAHDNPEMLKAQKKRLERAYGKEIIGHRSHYYRFAFPRSWMHQLENGFKYDASLGYPDVAGLRNGTSMPLPLYHADGYDTMIWYISTFILDQHAFMKDSIINWNEKGKEKIDAILEKTRNCKGILAVDWHVHGFNTEQFPNHYEPFTYILDKASKENAALVGFGQVVNTIEDRWRKLYSTELEFSELLKETHVQVKHNEIDSYKNIFAQINNSSLSIENASESFIQILPKDAEKILDIGCGPGNMNFKIPNFYRVLGIDLDEDILAGNIKATRIGDITNIPLVNKSVDLAMACDVLEHLDNQQLNLAIAELQRVSNKYIYIQVPLSEDLNQGVVTCKNCQEKWHVNYHKQSFEMQDLLEILPKDWVAKTVNFTGNVDYFKSNEKNVLEQLDISNNTIIGSRCPKCGTESELFGSDEVNSVRRMSSVNASTNSIFPIYSEIGILFEYNGTRNTDTDLYIVTRGNKRVEFKDVIRSKKSEIDFSASFNQQKVLTHYECIPTVVTNCVYIQQLEKESRFIKSSLATGGSVLFSYPIILEEEDKFILSGNAIEDTQIRICCNNILGNETLLRVENVSKGSFNIEVPISITAIKSKANFRVYWDISEIRLVAAKIITRETKDYLSYLYDKREFSHMEMIQDGITYRWLLPYEGVLFMSDEPKKWIESITNKVIDKIENKKLMYAISSSFEEYRLYMMALIEDKEKELQNYSLNQKIYESQLISIHQEMKQYLLKQELCESQLISIQQQMSKYVSNEIIYNNIILSLEQEVELYKQSSNEFKSKLSLLQSMTLMNIKKPKVNTSKLKLIIKRVVKKLVNGIKRCKWLYKTLNKLGAKKIYNILKNKYRGI